MAVYQIALSPKARELLAVMVKLARERQVLTLICARFSPVGSADGAVMYRIHAGSVVVGVDDVYEDALWALRVLGLIDFEQKGETAKVFLTTSAYGWVDYQRRGRLMRWLVRVFSSGKDTILIVVTGLTAMLTVLQILQLVGLL
jgi:hypothetical protein